MTDLNWIGPTLVGIAAVVQSTRAHGKAKDAKDEATAAHREASSAKEEAAGANRAVNHKTEGQPSIAEQVDRIDRRTLLHDERLVEQAGTISDVRRVLGIVRREMGSTVNTVGSIKRDLVQHLAHHQLEHERGDDHG